MIGSGRRQRGGPNHRMHKERDVSTTQSQACPDCGSHRDNASLVCAACGAPPRTAEGDQRSEQDGGVRTTDLEPYVTLRYIAKLFKVLAVLMVLMLLSEVTIGLMQQGTDAIISLVGEATRFLVLAGLLWGVGDLAILLIDLGHDIRVSRILLGRINAELHRRGGSTEDVSPSGQRSEQRVAPR